MTILESVLNVNARPCSPRRDPAGQQPRRDLEQLVRGRAAQLTDRLRDQGYSLREVADRLGLNPRTLGHWVHHTRRPGSLGDADALGAAPPARLRGRPLAPADTAQCQAVIAWLDRVGPGVGVPTLRTRFEEIARAELDDLVKAYRCAWRAEHRRWLRVLHWQQPGAVWAMDFAQAPCAIDGQYGYLLAVRDLASGRQLLWQPVLAPTAQVVLAELAVLFAMHGAPWVLKTDNGSAFRAEPLRWSLQRAGVYQLFSPPRTPAYNGSIEASIGSLKTRTEQQSERAGHPGWWTSATVEAARVEANTTARPRRLAGKTPD
jgi:transposase InsO family protein